MASFWEWVAERVGYGLAAVVLGPGALVERKAKTLAKRALYTFAHAHDAERLEVRRGTIRRLVRLKTAEEPVHVEISLDLKKRHAQVMVELPDLPRSTTVWVSRAMNEFHDDLRLHLGPPRAMVNTVRLDGTDVDDETASALVEEIAKGPLGGVRAFELSLAEGRGQLTVHAPDTSEAWQPIADGMIALTSWTRTKWAHSYRS